MTLYEELMKKRESGEELTLYESTILLRLTIDKVGENIKEATKLINEKTALGISIF